MGRNVSPVKDFIRETLAEHKGLVFGDLWYLARKKGVKVTYGTLAVMCCRMKKEGELLHSGMYCRWRLRRGPVTSLPEREAP